MELSSEDDTDPETDCDVDDTEDGQSLKEDVVGAQGTTLNLRLN